MVSTHTPDSTRHGRFARWLAFLGLLGALVVGPALAEARLSSSGATGCGDFTDSVTGAANGDLLFPMAGFVGANGAVINKKLLLQGGWTPGSGGGCGTAGTNTFNTINDLFSAGFVFAAPQTRSTLGGGLAIDPAATTLRIEHVELPTSFSAATGGSITGVISDHGLVTLHNILSYSDSNNETDSGGGIALEVRDHSRLTISDSFIHDNFADQDGGGFHLKVFDRSEVIIRNTQVTTNTAEASSGGGGKIIIASGYVTITDSVFSGNHADAGSGGGLRIERLAGSSGPAEVWLIRTDISGNSGQSEANLSVGPDVTVHVLDQNVYLPALISSVSPAVPRIDITNVTYGGADGTNYAVSFAAANYQPQLPGQHIHFFFNTVSESQAGAPGAGPWKIYAGPSPFTGWDMLDRPPGATALCALVANADHTIIPRSGDCYPLP